MTAIQEDAAFDDSFDVEAALLKSWDVDAETPSDADDEVKPEPRKRPAKEDTDAEDADADTSVQKKDQDEDADADDADKDDDAEDADEDKKFLDSDDVFVKVKVDGEEREFAVKDLKRLAGQEASLTRKSQEVADTRKQVNERAAVTVAALDKMLQLADQRWQQYAQYDFDTLAKNPDVSAEDYAALHKAAQAAWQERQLVSAELGHFAQQVQTQQKAAQAQAAQACLKVLTDPEKGIEGWSDKLYDDLLAYGVKQGLPQDVVLELVDPAAFKLLHKAMLFDRGQAQVKADKSKSKSKQAPKRIVKGTADARATREASAGKGRDAMARLRSSGTQEDAAAALLSRWAVDSDD